MLSTRNGKTHLPLKLIKAIAAHPEFAEGIDREWDRDKPEEERDGSVAFHKLTDDQLLVLSREANALNLPKIARIADAIIDFEGVIPSFDAAYGMMLRYLRKHLGGGWLYRDAGGVIHKAYLAQRLDRYDPSDNRRDRDDKPSLTLYLSANVAKAGKRSSRYGSNDTDVSTTIRLEPGDLTRRRVANVLKQNNLFFETPELRAQYDEQKTHAAEVIMVNHKKQMRWGKTGSGPGRKTILTTSPSAIAYVEQAHMQSQLVWDDEGPHATCSVPVHYDVNVFDLTSHEFERVNVLTLTPYVYNPALANKLILPESHMDMLDILTTNTDALLGDIVEGKSSGNIILCKGIPGIGKTLTAEIYSEIVGRPIYSVHSGSLGTNARDVEEALKTIFERVMSWDCILLLDEADVFVAERGSDLVQNAIVSVFLRVLEYFDGLMFMTTNRSDNIDDAIISRCAAIIDYGIPDRRDRAEIWKIMAEQQGYTLPEDLIVALLDAFPSVTPRDIKQLMRLALRVAVSGDTPLDEALFRRVAQFRAVEIAPVTNLVLSKGLPTQPRRQRPTKPAGA